MGIDGGLRWNGWFDMSPFLGEHSFMKTTLDLPDDLIREMKIRAATQGRKLKEVMADALRSGLSLESTGQPPTRPSITTDPELGHLLVQGPPNAPISKMTIEEILILEQDSLYQEDLQRVGVTISAKTEENHKVVFPDFNKLRKELGTDKIDGVNEVLRQRSEGL
jgi:plasmid stability protein